MERDLLNEGAAPFNEYDDLTCDACGEPLQEMTGERRLANTVSYLVELDDIHLATTSQPRDGWNLTTFWIEYRCPEHGYSGGSDDALTTFNVHEASNKRLSPDCDLADIEAVERNHDASH